jgi:LacI family transcriptional regulator
MFRIPPPKKRDKKMAKPTLSQIAKKLGVSTATVSLAMGENNRVSDKMRARIMAEMKEVGYVYQRSAAGLRTSKTNTIGIIINNVHDPFFSALLGSIEQELAKNGYTAFLCNTNEDETRQNDFIRKMAEYNADGIILSPAIGTSSQKFDEILEISPPVVFVSRILKHIEVDGVSNNDVQSARLATQHLIELGHRRIAFVGGTQDLSPFQSLQIGYLETLKRMGIDPDPSLILTGRPRRNIGFEAATQLLNMENRPTAAFGYNSIVTMGLKAGLEKLGMSIGKDFSLIGNEDTNECRMTNPSLSVISHDLDKMGKQVAETLLKRIANPDGEKGHHVIEPELIVRESSGVV